jgi:putative thiamine transport system ATP-binding protein
VVGDNNIYIILYDILSSSGSASSFKKQRYKQHMLQVKNLEFGYGAALVSGLSFSVPSGTMRLLHGPSGCGKSTLLAVLSGTAPTRLKWQGQIHLEGTDIGQLPAAARAVGLMFQDPLLFPHMNVGDNLAFGLTVKRRGRAARHDAIAEALDACSLAGFAERDPASLSGGQKARVALMRALLAEPKMLLLDEAFSSLDPELRAQFGGFVAAQIANRNIPALLVSHDAGDAALTSGPVIHFPNRQNTEVS